MTRVRIPPTLRAEVGGERQLEAAGGTVREVLEDLSGRFPALNERIWEDGDIADFVNVYVDGEDVRMREGADTTVSDASTVILLPAMAGGAATPLAGFGSHRAEPGSADASRRWRHGAFRARITHTVPSGPAPPATGHGRRG